MEKTTYGLFMGLLGLSSCIGHGLIRLVLEKKSDLRRQNFILLSLGVSDFFISIHAFMSTYAAFSSSWPFGDFGCQLDSFFGMAATFASVSNAAWIAKSKYYTICKPQKYFNARFIVKCLWIGALIGGSLPFFGFGEYGYETDDLNLRTGCLLTFKDVGVKYWIYIIFISVWWFLWPLYDIIQSYYQVSTKTGTYWLVFVVPLQLLVSLTPYAIFAVVTMFYNVTTLPGFYVAINNIAAKILIATNPYLYIISDEKLRQACSKFLFGEKVTEENNKEE